MTRVCHTDTPLSLSPMYQGFLEGETMAEKMLVGDMWRFIMNGTDGDRHFHIGLDWVVVSITGTGGSDSTACGAIEGTFAPLLKAVLNDNATYDATTSRRLYPVALRPASQEAHAAAGPGTAGPTAAPRQTCGVISKYTALLGRANRGRIYMPFPAAQDDAGNGVPSVGYLSRLDAFAAAYLAGITVSDGGGNQSVLGAILFHRKLLTNTFIETWVSQPKWATQRRRGSYRPPRRKKKP